MMIFIGSNIFLLIIQAAMIYIEVKSVAYYRRQIKEYKEKELDIQRRLGEAMEANRQAQQLFQYAKDGFVDDLDGEVKIDAEPTKH